MIATIVKCGQTFMSFINRISLILVRIYSSFHDQVGKEYAVRKLLRCWGRLSRSDTIAKKIDPIWIQLQKYCEDVTFKNNAEVTAIETKSSTVSSLMS